MVVRVNPAGAVYSRFPAGAHVSLPRIAGHRDADSTDCPGAWSLAGTLSPSAKGTMVRALHPGGTGGLGAAVSDPPMLAGVFTAQATPAPTP